MTNLIKTWIITDTHWRHYKIMEYCDRPDNFEELITKNWKNLVKPQDVIIHLGDVIFGNQQQLKDILNDLPGKESPLKGRYGTGTAIRASPRRHPLRTP